MKTANGHVIDDWVGTKEMYFVGDTDLIKRYVALIKVNGKKMPINDDSAISKCVDGDTRQEARLKGKAVLERIKSRRDTHT